MSALHFGIGTQTALMQACQHGHWEVVLILVLFGANVSSLSFRLAFTFGVGNFLVIHIFLAHFRSTKQII